MIEGLQELTGKVVSTQTLDGNVDGEFISSGEVNDVLVNGTSVVENKVANVIVPTELKDLSGDSTHRVVTDDEKTTWNSKSNFSGNYNDLSNKPTIPTKTSELTNNSGFITNTVNNLTNYYLKSETYTKNEVNTLISNIEKLTIEIVQTLPETGESNVLYLVPKEGSTNDVYDEYLYINNSWEHLGSTEIDLSNYYTKTETNTLLDGKQNMIVYRAVLSAKEYTGASLNYLGNADKEIFRNILQDAYDKQLNNFAILVSIIYGNGTGTNTLFKTFIVTATQTKKIIDKPTSINLAGFCQDLTSLGDLVFNKLGLAITLSWSGDTLSVSTIILRNLKQRYLDTNNTDYTYIPTGDYNPATKKYVDDKATTKQDTLVSGTNIKTINNESILGEGNLTIQSGSTIQYDTMPTPSADYLNKIIQYTGTNGTYKNGYFYKCKSTTSLAKLVTTGGSIIPLNIYADNHKLELKFKPTTLDGWHKLMATDEDAYGSIIITNGGEAVFGIDGNYYYQYDIDWQSEDIYTALYNDFDGAFGINGTIVDYVTSYDGANNLNLFAPNSSNLDEAYKGYFYGLKVWDNTTEELIMDLVPSQNNNTPALYDTINETYYYDSNSSMTYVAGGTTYYWERVDIQPSSNIIGLDMIWTNTWQKINASDKLLSQFLDIANEYGQSTIKTYSLGSYLLTGVSMTGQSSEDDYTAYELTFEKMENGNDKTRVIYFYSNYAGTEIYDSTEETYYPKTGSQSITTFASSSDFDDYLSKSNTTSYIPTQPYHPATKAYADSVTDNCIIQYTTLPTPTADGEIAQYIGTTTSSYHKNYFYQMTTDTSSSTPILTINDDSSFALNYEFQATDKLEVKFKPTMEYPEDSGIIGNEEDESQKMEIHLYDVNMYIGSGDEEHGIAEVYNQNTVYTIVLNDDDDIVINGETKKDNITFTSGGTIKLFDYQGNKGFRGDFYYLRIYDKTTGNLKKEWIPALDQNDVPCLYESVGETYIYNSETPSTPNTYAEIYDTYYWQRVDVQPPIADGVATTTYVDNKIGNINTILASLTTPSNGGN